MATSTYAKNCKLYLALDISMVTWEKLVYEMVYYTLQDF